MKNKLNKNQNTFLPTTIDEIKSRGWKRLDVILITGDAYIDHPSFGVAVISRYLESLGVKVGIIASPNINNNNDFKKLGTPSWFFGITSGNLDSMLMIKTAAKKRRSGDAYLPKGSNIIRPAHAVIAYSNKIKELFSGTQILLGGLETSLRRYAHYDYWDNKVRRSILLDSRADMLVYGMGEQPLKEIIKNVRQGKKLKEITGVRGTSIIINSDTRKSVGSEAITIPSCEEVTKNKLKYNRASKIINENQNPYCSKILVQKHRNRYVCTFPPSLPMSTKDLDKIYSLPFNRVPHFSYKTSIPAYEMIKFSVTSMRGCFGGCSFCSLTVHQGKKIQTRSVESIIKEIKVIAKLKGFTGYISDVGGPTANMYGLKCKKQKAEFSCKKPSCLFPKICELLKTDHTEQIKMLEQTRKIDKIKKVFISSGIRFDLANKSPEYIKTVAKHHVSGQLKTAPEHSDPKVLSYMKKPGIDEYDKFSKMFMEESRKAGLEQYLVPYFIAAHPGCGINEQLSLLQYLKKNRLRPRQIQQFIPLPLTLSSDMYYTGTEPFTGEKVVVVKDETGRKKQKKILQYYKTRK